MTEQRDHLYPRVVRAVAETPWAILPTTLAAIIDLIGLRAQGDRLSDDEIQARIGGRQARRDFQMAGSVAVIPVYGVITRRADMFSEISGGTSVQRLQGMLRDALADDGVTAILLDVDSPGGQLSLIPELASEIRGARGKKPIVAVANTMAASAAYWLAAQADEVVATPSGLVGSVGVFAAHDDISALQEKLGVKTTLISAGEHKTDGNPYEPLSDDARETIQGLVDDAYASFVSDLAKGRGVGVDTVRSDFGQGRVLTPKDALNAGMIDRIDTLEATLKRLARTRVAPTVEPPPDPAAVTDPEAAMSGLSYADLAGAARAANLALVNRTRSLAEFRDRGRLTAAKRSQLEDVVAALDLLGEEKTAIAELLALTDRENREEPPTLGLDAEHDWQLATTRL